MVQSHNGAWGQWPRSRAFDDVWRALSALGACDGLGGAEYRRVRREWLRADSPSPIVRFIRRRANIGPDEPPFNPSDPFA